MQKTPILSTLISGLLVFMISCQETSEKKSGYEINLHLNNLAGGKAVLANLDLVTNERLNLDSAQIAAGSCTFTGSIEAPYLHSLIINDTVKIHFFLENSTINITGDYNDPATIRIAGSREDSLFRAYPMDSIFARQTGMEIMLNHADYAFAAFTAYYQFQIFNIDLDTMTMILERFTPAVKMTAYYKHLLPLFAAIKRVSIGQPAPEFSMPDRQGNLIKLSDFKGQYVLLDFWASWCAPCRAANPDLVKVYEQFHDQGFTILGVSVDKNRGKWLKAIAEDGLEWPNLSEANGWNAITDLYGVKAVPQNFLLDPRGVIIAKNIEPEALTQRLEALLNSKAP